MPDRLTSYRIDIGRRTSHRVEMVRDGTCIEITLESTPPATERFGFGLRRAEVRSAGSRRSSRGLGGKLLGKTSADDAVGLLGISGLPAMPAVPMTVLGGIWPRVFKRLIRSRDGSFSTLS